MKSPASKLNQPPHLGGRAFPKLMLTPTLVIMAVLTAYPLVFTFVYSFTNYNYLKHAHKSPDFILFKNYIDLFKNGYFRQAVVNTVVFTLLAVALEIFFGLLVAVFINSLKRGQKVMRTLLLLPYLLPAVTVALSWRMMLSPNYGIINQVLETFGLPVHNWFMDTKTAFGTVLLIDVWQNIPFVFLLLYASLQSVSQDQYEAALIDGASSWQSFIHITVPHIKVVVGLLVVLRTIWVFNNFDIIYMTTAGGPASMTTTMPLYIYDLGWTNKLVGRASAASIILLLFLIVVCIAYFAVITHWEKEDQA